jgi:hypothetical protein
MTITLTTDLEAFADSQGKVQRSHEERLLGSARYALRHWGEKGWYDALLAHAEGALRSRYRTESGQRTSPLLKEVVDASHARWSKMMDATKKPTPETIESQAKAIAASLSTSAVNEAVEAAAHDSDTPDEVLEKVWVSMEDEKVRPTHAAAHGQAVPLSDKFHVGESELTRPGDTTAAIGEWINCRCLMAVRERAEAVVASAATAEVKKTGVGVFAIPADDDPIREMSTEDIPHLTTLWFGNLGDDFAGDLDLIKEALAVVVQGVAPFDLATGERSTLGDEDADVLMMEAGTLGDLREDALTYDDIAAAHNAVEQFPEWTPHLTLGYPDTPSPAADEDLPATIRIDRLALWAGEDRTEFPLNGESDMADDDNIPDEELPPPPASDEERIGASGEPIPFWGVMAPEGVLSGDQRRFKADSLRARPLPLPYAFQRSNEPGHDGSVKVANIERLWRRDGKVYGLGHFLTTVPEVDEVVGIMAESGGKIGTSIDADDGKMEMVLKDGRNLEEVLAENADKAESDEDIEGVDFDDLITEFSSARICGATACHIPAFHEAFIMLGDVPEEFAPKDGEDLAVESIEEQEVAAAALAAAGGVKTEDGPGWITHPIDTDRLRDYWVHGKGSKEINWGVPGDFNRCRVAVAAYVKPQHLNGYCANRHYDALGFWPGRPLAGDTIVASGAPDEPQMAPAINLVAAAPMPLAAPAEWFSNPNLTGPSPIVVTEDGRVYGHAAEWGVCHIGLPGVCTTAPESESGYAYYRTGSYLTAEGTSIPVGTITLGTGHADLEASASIAMAHYDNTGTAAAYVASGEDEFGIWVAGAVSPKMTPEDIVELRGAKLSGDWRWIGNAQEMVACLAVNVGGFPVPHTGLAASGGHVTALVAAGIVDNPVAKGPHDIKQIVSMAIDEYENRKARDREMQAHKAAMEELAGEVARTEMAALAGKE